MKNRNTMYNAVSNVIRSTFACCALTTVAFAAPVDSAHREVGGTVFATTNAVGENQILIFDRAADGSLRAHGRFPTGGAGTGTDLGSQGALALSRSGNWLLSVNAGSNSVSAFLVLGERLIRTDVHPSGGSRPISVTIDENLVYVLNAGSDDVQGFLLDTFGRLAPIAGSHRPLSGSAVDAAEVSFNRDGDLLAVTEKATNRVVTFAVDGDGKLGTAHFQDSPAPTPFGFAFGRRDQLFVSEAAGAAAGLSSLSSYEVGADGVSTVVTAASPNAQTAACWVAVTRDGRYAYVSNTVSDNLSAYEVAEDGSISLAASVAAQTEIGGHPSDLTFDRNEEFLYALNPGTSTISAFRINKDGTLQLVEHQSLGSSASAAAGLVAR